MSNTMSYVLGLVFNKSKSEILLIRKNRPSWQAGKLNGIGGKIEAAESPLQAMVRECKEETDISVPAGAWVAMGRISGPNFELFVFSTELSTNTISFNSLTDEQLELHSSTSSVIDSDGVSNLGWLVRMGLDPDSSRFTFEVAYD